MLELSNRVEYLEDEIKAIKEALNIKEKAPVIEPVNNRESIVADAKCDVEGLLNSTYLPKLFPQFKKVPGVWFINKGYICITNKAEFIINKEKRTIVCLIKHIESSKIELKGIAKCAPNDCFNVHIGKAIALRRALGLDVPNEYLHAPQPEPEDMQPGDIVEVKGRKVKVFAVRPTHRTVGKGAGQVFVIHGTGFTWLTSSGDEWWCSINEAKIIDDSRDE